MKKQGFVFLLLASSLFSGCSSNDSETEKATSSGGMTIGVSLSSVSTRVTETADAVKGLITAWESTDSLRVFHKYTKNGTVGSMQGFKFTAAGSGSSTTFKYSGTSEYSFTSGNSLYAFNALPTSGNYTKTYNTSTDNFTLSLSGLDSQDGTVSNLRNYDAMYGTSTVSSGTPSAMSMNHLLSVVRFDVSDAAFSGTLTSVNFTYTPTTGSSILPASGDFTLSNAGTLATGTLTGATSWSVSNVAVSSGTAPVYLMTFPDTRSGTLTITATDSGGNTYSRTITLSNFSLTSGSMKAYTVTLNAAAVVPPPGSNSYIVAPGATIYIPVSRATAGNSANFPDGSSFSTGLLWSDVSATHVTPTVSDRYIKVVAGTTEGNSVVYAKNTSGNIVWSWHIWVTSYVPNTTTINYNGKVWMDRNLGAQTNGTTSTAYGLYYQWGRKDPFPGGTHGSSTMPTTYGTSPATIGSGSVSLLTSIQNPNIFYKNYTISPYDWLTPQKDVLWNNSGKTVYDPCPDGWRVPLNTEFSGVFLSNTLSGCWADGGVFYSAASIGVWWSGVINGTTAYGLLSGGNAYFDSRAHGFSVRCVKN